ncbi:unnamed protein product [Rotaria socialis]
MATNSVVSESNADSNIIIIHDDAQYSSNKHQSLFEEWKSNDDPSIKSTNQPKINSVFSSGGEKYPTNNK